MIVSQILSFLLLGTMVSWEDIWILIQGTSKEFDEIKRNDNGPSDSEIQTMIDQLEIGDLILRRIDSCETFYHVGLYIGRRLVIDFTGNNISSQCPKIISFICNISSYSRVQITKMYFVSFKILKHSVYFQV